MGGTDRVRVAALEEITQGGDKGRLDDFYPGTLPDRDFDEERLDGFYPEGASKEPEPAGPRLSRRARIALGVGISILAVGIALGAAAAVVTRNIKVFE